MNDYIINDLDETLSDPSDIALVVAESQINVVEAMINCYEKQLIMLEYNEESAYEIMMESRIIMEASDDKRPLSVKAKAVFNRMISALKTLVLSIIDQIRAMKFKTLIKKLKEYAPDDLASIAPIGIFQTYKNSNDKRFKAYKIFSNSEDIAADMLEIAKNLKRMNEFYLEYDPSEFNENVGLDKKEFTKIAKDTDELCDKIINVNYDDEPFEGTNVLLVGKIIGVFNFLDGECLKELRAISHYIQKWNVEYAKYFDNEHVDEEVVNTFRNTITKFTKALVLYQKCIGTVYTGIKRYVDDELKEEKKFDDEDD